MNANCKFNLQTGAALLRLFRAILEIGYAAPNQNELRSVPSRSGGAAHQGAVA